MSFARGGDPLFSRGNNAITGRCLALGSPMASQSPCLPRSWWRGCCVTPLQIVWLGGRSIPWHISTLPPNQSHSTGPPHHRGTQLYRVGENESDMKMSEAIN